MSGRSRYKEIELDPPRYCQWCGGLLPEEARLNMKYHPDCQKPAMLWKRRCQYYCPDNLQDHEAIYHYVFRQLVEGESKGLRLRDVLGEPMTDELIHMVEMVTVSDPAEVVANGDRLSWLAALMEDVIEGPPANTEIKNLDEDLLKRIHKYAGKEKWYWKKFPRKVPK